MSLTTSRKQRSWNEHLLCGRSASQPKTFTPPKPVPLISQISQPTPKPQPQSLQRRTDTNAVLPTYLVPKPLPLDVEYLEPATILTELERLRIRMQNTCLLDKMTATQSVPLIALIADGSAKPHEAYIDTWISLKYWAGAHGSTPFDTIARLNAPSDMIGVSQIRDIIDWVLQCIYSLTQVVKDWPGLQMSRAVPCHEKTVRSTVTVLPPPPPPPAPHPRKSLVYTAWTNRFPDSWDLATRAPKRSLKKMLDGTGSASRDMDAWIQNGAAVFLPKEGFRHNFNPAGSG